MAKTLNDDVVQLDEHREHLAGPVICLRCSKSWVAVRPEKTLFCECPSCGALQGASFMTMLTFAEPVFGDECCGQTDSDGVCCAPACIRGEALKFIDNIRLAYFLEHPL